MDSQFTNESRGSATFPLNNDFIHVWAVHCSVMQKQIPLFSEFLSEEEKIRLDNFKFSLLKKHFIIRRGILRLILGNYLEKDPGEIKFSYDQQGKPYLKDNKQFRKKSKTICFNLTFSHDVILYAFTLQDKIGIDIEYVQDQLIHGGVEEQFFSLAELTQFNKTCGKQRARSFFQAWTRKEAIAKTIGKGLLFPLEKIEVTLGHYPRALKIKEDEEIAKNWKLYNIDQLNGYVGTIATEGMKKKLKFITIRQELLSQLLKLEI